MAISAAALWGVTYAFSERLLRVVSVPSLLFFSSFASTVVMLAVALLTGRLGPDLRAIGATKGVPTILAALIVTYILANVAITYSISGRNATTAAFIEIAYPLFTALAVWLFFRELQLSVSMLIGGLLIFSGAVIIGLFSK